MNLNIEFGEHWHASLFGLTVNMDTVLTAWLAMIIVLIISAIVSVGLKRTPGKFQSFAEMVYGALESIPVSQIGAEGKNYTPIIGSLFLFILTCNLIGQLPWKLLHISEGEFASPTNDINLTAALAILAIIYYVYSGIKKKGLFKYLKEFLPPMGLIEILDLVTRPLSLSLRLFANILAGEIIIMVMLGLLAAFLPIPMMLFEVFVAFIQAFIFAILTASYVAGAIKEE
ncbi:MAG: F0F1 ATP synthase subunit A [bacterium]|nr:F0F1 ATP synthase subunit A [bacterium]